MWPLINHSEYVDCMILLPLIVIKSQLLPGNLYPLIGLVCVTYPQYGVTFASVAFRTLIILLCNFQVLQNEVYMSYWLTWLYNGEACTYLMFINKKISP